MEFGPPPARIGGMSKKSKAGAKSKQAEPPRSRTPHSEEFLKFIGSGWIEAEALDAHQWDVAQFAAARRLALAAQFPGKILLIEAGDLQTRSNDTEYRYRPHSAFAHLTGWGAAAVPQSALVIDARKKSAKATLFFRPTAGRGTSEFFANPAIGEFWVGPRPDLQEVAAQLAITTRALSDLGSLRKKHGKRILTLADADLARAVSELRMVKDAFEVSEMRKAVAATALGFNDIVRALPAAVRHPRGERVIEGAFFARARLEGNDLGYETIAAAGAHACTLHWIRNDGPVRRNDLVLVDAGVELDSLYTADITRTLPASGKFSKQQRRLYEIVLKAADAAFAAAKPGVKFREVHEAAMQVIAHEVAKLGILPITPQESLAAERQLHRRWMVHGTSHHLGLDVHDCAQARRELYLDSELKPGMIFTIEPGLYFHADDELVPQSMRGIGIRIEDDVLVTETGVENLSRDLPRNPEEIESWMASLLN